MMGRARVDEGGAELGEGASRTYVQRCRGWVDGTACDRPGDDGRTAQAGIWFVHVLIRPLPLACLAACSSHPRKKDDVPDLDVF